MMIPFWFTLDLIFFYREKENPPTLFPNSSPWCHSPNAPAHPYCPLIEPHNTSMAGSSLDRQPRPQSTGSDPAQVRQSTYSTGELRDVGGRRKREEEGGERRREGDLVKGVK